MIRILTLWIFSFFCFLKMISKMVFFVIVPNLMDHFHHMPHSGWKDSKKESHFHDNWAFFNVDRKSIFTLTMPLLSQKKKRQNDKLKIIWICLQSQIWWWWSIFCQWCNTRNSLVWKMSLNVFWVVSKLITLHYILNGFLLS